MAFAASVAFLLGLCALLSYYFRNSGSDKSTNQASIASQNGSGGHERYLAFRNNYLFVYLCMMASDWLQGPYVYALYKSYNYGLDAIGVLFIVGFLSSALFGTVISSLADRHGRKKFCLAFSVIYIGSCFTKLSPNYAILLLGRLLGGISTSLLFSVFESWMVSEHFSRGFAPELLSSTFSWATYGNGLIAISSGLLANGVVSITGSLVSPFMLSALFLAIGGLTVQYTWGENYGEQTKAGATAGASSLVKGLRAVKNDPTILAVGLIVAMFESSMYIFVFEWGPVLERQDPQLPFGLVFAAFMVCIMIGSIVFRVLLDRRWTVEKIAPPVLLVAALSMVIPVYFTQIDVAFWAFNVFEFCCGVYFPTLGTIRSKYVPEETRTSVMNLFRLPLNLIVVVVLSNVSEWSAESIFMICFTLLLGSYGASLVLENRSGHGSSSSSSYQRAADEGGEEAEDAEKGSVSPGKKPTPSSNMRAVESL